jgi:hypothetical protein
LMKEAIVNYFLEEKSNDCTLEVNDFWFCEEFNLNSLLNF